MGEADKQRARAAKQKKKAAAKSKGGNTTGGRTKPQPDTTDRNQPCRKALALKPHLPHRYRSGDQQMHCQGVQ